MAKIIDRKYKISLKSNTPLDMDEKWVRKLNCETKSISQIGAQPVSIDVIGENPAIIKNRQATTAMIKLITWLRVREEVILPILKKAPAINMLPT